MLDTSNWPRGCDTSMRLHQYLKEGRDTPAKRAEHAPINACMPGYGKPWVNTNQHAVNPFYSASKSQWLPKWTQPMVVDSVWPWVWSYQDIMQLMQVKEAMKRCACTHAYNCI